MQISKRLKEVAHLVTKGSRVADIGCDHAYTSIYMIEKEIASNVIAMDVNQGPIDRAKENIKRYRMENRIQVRKSNGLDRLETGEVDTVLIAGMGGALMVQILMAHPKILSEVQEVVLQPQSEVFKVREMLSEQGFSIVMERMMIEDDKYYVMMKGKRSSGLANPSFFQMMSQEHYHFGRLLLEEKNPILYSYLCKEKEMYHRIYQGLNQDKTSSKIFQRVSELREILICIEKALQYYQ